MATEILRADADGDEVALLANGAASDWDCVDEASPDDDTTYLSNNTTTFVYDSLNLQASGLGGETITAIDAWDRCRVGASAGAQDEKEAGVRLGGANTMGSPVQLTTTYTDRESAALARPGGGSWAVSDLASLQVRIGLRENGSSTARCTQAWIEVNYTAGGSAQPPRTVHQHRLRRAT